MTAGKPSCRTQIRNGVPASLFRRFVRASCQSRALAPPATRGGRRSLAAVLDVASALPSVNPADTGPPGNRAGGTRAQARGEGRRSGVGLGGSEGAGAAVPAGGVDAGRTGALGPPGCFMSWNSVRRFLEPPVLVLFEASGLSMP